MDLRHYLAIAKRHRWLIIQAAVIVAIVAGVLASLKTPYYQADARVLLRPNDPSEQLYSTYFYYDPDRFLEIQTNIITSKAVATEAAKSVSGSTADELLGEVSVGQSATTDILTITGTSLDPVRARDVANAFSRAYIENRRLEAVGDLQRVADELLVQQNQLQADIAEFDRQIGDGGLGIGATTALEQPTAPTTDTPTQPDIEEPTAPDVIPEAPATTEESLKAARYAAAVQYQEVYARRQELLINMSLKRGGAELLEEAVTPGAPVGSSTTRNAILGGIVGLLLGCGVALLREQLDDRARTREEVEELSGLPVLAELPLELPGKSKNELAIEARPMGALAEATRALRTSLHFLGVDQPIRRLVITSPEPGDGKSLIAANLAAAYAQAGYVTVLVSADLRRPRLEEIFHLQPGVRGLTDVVAELPSDRRPHGLFAEKVAETNGNGNGNGNGRPRPLVATLAHNRSGTTARSELTTALVETGVENLFLLPSGSTPPNPAELLDSRRTAELLDQLGADADMLILDTPPVVAVTDAAVLASKADGVVLVTSLGSTHRAALKRAVETLNGSQVRLLGVALNRVTGGSPYTYGYYRDASTSEESEPRRTRMGRKRTPVEAGKGAER